MVVNKDHLVRENKQGQEHFLKAGTNVMYLIQVRIAKLKQAIGGLSENLNVTLKAPCLFLHDLGG